ncbi:unnamed protein product [Closterium sp. NIES-54]
MILALVSNFPLSILTHFSCLFPPPPHFHPISSPHVQTEGIFRVAAENDHEDQIRDQVNMGLVPQSINVHALAGLIKVRALRKCCEKKFCERAARVLRECFGKGLLPVRKG